MTSQTISYHKGKSRYQLADDYVIDIGFPHSTGLRADYVDLSTDGVLSIERGFTWDGVTGLAFNTRNFARASLVHDAIFHLMREVGRDPELHEKADDLFRTIALDDGVHVIRVNVHCTSLRLVRSLGWLPGKKRLRYSAP